MIKVFVEERVEKALANIYKSNKKAAKKITLFINERLPNAENPYTLPNCKKMKNYENYYRWRLGDYRIIGIVIDGKPCIIQIIKIAKRDESTYKGL